MSTVTSSLSNTYTTSLKCENDENNKGPLQSKIGLLSADEVELSGLSYAGSNKLEYMTSNSYLKEDYTWWTMAPAGLRPSYSPYGYLWNISANPINMNIYTPSTKYALRAVISLNKDAKIRSGKGTSSNPYVIL